MLNWNWEDKIGEVEIFNYDRTVTYNLYDGNAFLIMLYEYEENGEQMYSMHNFFVDEGHAKRCFGLDKKDKDTYGINIFNKPQYKIQKIRIDKNFRYAKKLITMLVEAFDEISIELYSSEKGNK